MLPRLLLAALLTVLLVTPSARAATTYCVGVSCEGIPKASIDAALTAAATSPGKDAIMLGDGPYTGAWTITAANPVDIVGPESGAKIVSTGSAALAIDAPEVLVENLKIQTKAVNGAHRRRRPRGVGEGAARGRDGRAGHEAPGRVPRAQRRTAQRRCGRRCRRAARSASSRRARRRCRCRSTTSDLTGQHGLRAWEWTKPVRVERLRREGERHRA